MESKTRFPRSTKICPARCFSSLLKADCPTVIIMLFISLLSSVIGSRYIQNAKKDKFSFSNIRSISRWIASFVEMFAMDCMDVFVRFSVNDVNDYNFINYVMFLLTSLILLILLIQLTSLTSNQHSLFFQLSFLSLDNI